MLPHVCAVTHLVLRLTGLRHVFAAVMTTQWLDVVDLGRWRKVDGHRRHVTSVQSVTSRYSDTDQTTAYNPRDSYYDDKRYMPKLEPTVSETTLKSISHQDNRHHKFYKPTSNRSWFIAIFLLAIAVGIALLEIARVTHYDASEVKAVETKQLLLKRTEIVWVQQEEIASLVPTPATPTSAQFFKAGPSPHIKSTSHGILRRQVNGSPANGEATPAVDGGLGHSSNFQIPNETSTPIIGSPNIETTTPPVIPPSIETSNNDGAETTIPSPVSNGDTTTDGPGQPYHGDQVTVTDPSQDSPTVQPYRGDQVTVTDPSQVSYTPKPEEGHQLTVTDPANGSIENTKSQSLSSDKGSETNHDTSPAFSPAPADQLTVTDQDGTTIAPGAPNPAAQVTVTSAQDGGSVLSHTSPSIASVLSGSLIVSGTSIIGTVPTSSRINSGSNTKTGISNALGEITLTNSNGKATSTVAFTGAAVQTDSNGNPTATVSYSVSTSKATEASSAISEKSSKSAISTQFDYFLALYLPNILCVILASAWLVVTATFKIMQPFYSMASPGGAAAASTLTADYLTSGLSLTFGRAALDGHWVLLLAGTVQLFLAIVLLLVPEAMNIVPTAYCKTEISATQPCRPIWVIDTSFIRGMEVLLVGCFSMIVMILVLNRRRVSGVYTDPSKIATMADILVHKPLIQELRDIPPTASKTEIEMDLRDSRYMLGTFIADRRQHYGIIKLDNDPLPENEASEPRLVASWRHVNLKIEHFQDRIHKNYPYLLDILSIVLAFILFMLILVYRLLPGTDKDKSGFNLWMSSGHRGPKLVFSGLAVTTGFLVKRRERMLRLSHPYVLMSKRPRPASDCITSDTCGTQFTSLFKSAKTGNVSLALLSLAAILTDVLLIILPGIPWSAAQTAPVYQASTYCCLIILAVIFTAMVRAIFKQWRRGHHVDCPETLAAVLMRLCGSQFVEEKNFNAEEHHHLMPSFGEDDEDKQHRRYDGVDGQRKYTFGCMEGVDGVQRYMVDEDFWVRRAAMDLGMHMEAPRH